MFSQSPLPADLDFGLQVDVDDATIYDDDLFSLFVYEETCFSWLTKWHTYDPLVSAKHIRFKIVYIFRFVPSSSKNQFYFENDFHRWNHCREPTHGSRFDIDDGSFVVVS